ncbi:unnamed protein product [Spirodela intermedia]|uniref:FAS1 domain-containing protein n=2 Tax=Spirodela intermedia TaxID=51605 RepID=A0A7I8K0F1_SPIIN|nr:unnamed protein product [Spirodela intermedia]CAA6655114.1 unnamed protein product [Spirodela intermedia]CAA7389867.1 unnamed protein product [Spirodela intermedia]
MRLSRQRLKMGGFHVISFASLCLLLSLWSLLLLLNAHLPDLPPGPYKLLRTEETKDVQLGKLGEMMISMLPDDLPFTLFVPSESAFQGVLQLNSSDSLLDQKVNETFAILSRVMGFSTVPLRLASREVPTRKEVLLDSVSGFRLHAHRRPDGALIVNNVRAELADITRGEIMIHIMSGVLMDAEFEQSFRPDYED